MNPPILQSLRRNLDGFETLLSISRDAVTGIPPLYIFSVLGFPSTWVRVDDRFSEFTLANPWRLGRAIRFLWQVNVPAIPRNPPVFGPPQLNRVFWEPSVILQRPDHNGSVTSSPDEAWFFINGIMTNDAVAQLNSAYLAQLFHRPITMIWNATDSWPFDLFECAVGKQASWNVEPAVVAFPLLYDALKDSHKSRVVVIAHSQGTIIMANILRLLRGVYKGPRPGIGERGLMEELMPLGFAPPEFVYPDHTRVDLGDFAPLHDDELAKLEVYLFANCANQIPYLRGPESGVPPLPWIESYGNEFDIVARLGMLAPDAHERGIELAGPMYRHDGAWGHLLGAHYLNPLARHQRRGRRRGGNSDAEPFVLLNPDVPHYEWPRLFDYINGGSPDPEREPSLAVVQTAANNGAAPVRAAAG
ncbi:MAG: hypothetical protein U0822_03255 [Anaerolineae bacterium]